MSGLHIWQIIKGKFSIKEKRVLILENVREGTDGGRNFKTVVNREHTPIVKNNKEIQFLLKKGFVVQSREKGSWNTNYTVLDITEPGRKYLKKNEKVVDRALKLQKDRSLSSRLKYG